MLSLLKRIIVFSTLVNQATVLIGLAARLEDDGDQPAVKEDDDSAEISNNESLNVGVSETEPPIISDTELEAKKKEMQDLIAVVTENITRLKLGVEAAYERARRIEKSLLKDLDFRTIAPEDLPRTVAPEKGEGGTGGIECPSNCDPKICENSPATPTQCFKVDRSQKPKRHICSVYEDAGKLRCPKDYVRCAMAAPTAGEIYTLIVDEPPSAGSTESQSITIGGYNLHQCLKLLIVPEVLKCTPENIPIAMDESLQIMGLGSLASYPHIKADAATPGKSTAEFTNVHALRKGKFKICLAQFAQPPEQPEPLILGIEPIGTLNVISREDAPKKAKKRARTSS